MYHAYKDHTIAEMSIRLLLLLLMVLVLFVQETSAQNSSLPGCQQTCGNLIIPYPFGIGNNCSADQTLRISCNNSFNPPKAFLNDYNLEVLDISIEAGTIQVYHPIIKNCTNRSNDRQVNLSGPLTFSGTQNQFTAMGCDNLAVISRAGTSVGGCMSFCNISGSADNTCFGINCCQTRIPSSLKFINATLRGIDPVNGQNGCRYAFIVDQNWFGNLTDIFSVQTMEQVPAVLDWKAFGFCNSFEELQPSTNGSVCGRNTICTNQSLCSCIKGYEGNPYLPDGCQDIDECARGGYCTDMCTNTPGSYNCSCEPGSQLFEGYTWDVRIRVAAEVAGALSYLHSAASVPVYHRDIKSTNILLDDKYRAKIADFGTSRSISIDQTHVTTKVLGTFGYLDPEYFQSSQFTDKSDVYSFGVVLVELLTGQKPIMAPRHDDEARSLVTHFMLAMEENRILDIIDSRIEKEGKKEEVIAFSNLAYRCLNLNGRKRPTMKQIAAELESIRMSHPLPTGQQHFEEVEFAGAKAYEDWELASTSMSSSAYNSVTVDIEPLITKF